MLPQSLSLVCLCWNCAQTFSPSKTDTVQNSILDISQMSFNSILAAILMQQVHYYIQLKENEVQKSDLVYVVSDRFRILIEVCLIPETILFTRKQLSPHCTQKQVDTVQLRQMVSSYLFLLWTKTYKPLSLLLPKRGQLSYFSRKSASHFGNDHKKCQHGVHGPARLPQDSTVCLASWLNPSGQEFISSSNRISSPEYENVYFYFVCSSSKPTIIKSDGLSLSCMGHGQ